MKLRNWLSATVALLAIISCGGSGTSGGSFGYGQKYLGNWMDVDNNLRTSHFYILLDEQGNIVSAKSYASQGARCSIAGSVHKNGSSLDLTVQLTVDEGNAVCTNIALSASGQLTYNSGSKWWTGQGTGTFSDNPNSQRRIALSLVRNDEW